MFKKLLLLTALTTGFSGFQVSAMETAEAAQAVAAPTSGGATQWLKHFAVACLVYNIIGTIERKAMDALFPIVIQPENLSEMQTAQDLPGNLADMHTMIAVDGDEPLETQQPKIQLSGKNLVIRTVAALATMYGCYKLTNHLHQKMSPESYRWAHILGALF